LFFSAFSLCEKANEKKLFLEASSIEKVVAALPAALKSPQAKFLLISSGGQNKKEELTTLDIYSITISNSTIDIYLVLLYLI